MCDHKPTPAGQEPDHGDGVKIYRHEFDGLIIRTHRTVRSTPAGWVWAVYTPDMSTQLAQGYQSTQRDALSEAAHRVTGRCGFTPAHRGDRPAVESSSDYTGKRVAA